MFSQGMLRRWEKEHKMKGRKHCLGGYTMNDGICPICHKENHCHMVSGEDPSTCWCTTVSFPDGLLLLVPEEARNLACVCEACVTKFQEEGAEGISLYQR